MFFQHFRRNKIRARRSATVVFSVFALAMSETGPLAQDRIIAVDDEREMLLNEYRVTLREALLQEHANEAKTAEIVALQRSKEDVLRQIEVASSFPRELRALLEGMTGDLEYLISSDAPFRLEERIPRLEKIYELMSDPLASSLQQFTALIEAYFAEVEYGRSIEFYEDRIYTGDEIYMGDGIRNVELLRIGRIAFLAKEHNSNTIKFWDVFTGDWLEQSDFRARQFQQVRRVVEGAGAPQYLLAPLAAPSFSNYGFSLPSSRRDEAAPRIASPSLEEVDAQIQIRVTQFLRARSEQMAMLQAAREKFQAALEAKERLEEELVLNRSQIQDLQADLDIHWAPYEDLFTLARSSAERLAGSHDNSLLSHQFPDISTYFRTLSNTQGPLTLVELRSLYEALASQIVLEGKVIRYQGAIHRSDGTEFDTEIVRIGPFTLLADGKIAYFDSELGLLRRAFRPPPGKVASVARNYYYFDGDRAALAPIDPTFGDLILDIEQTPTLLEFLTGGRAPFSAGGNSGDTERAAPPVRIQ